MATTPTLEDPQLAVLDICDEVAGAVRALRAIEALLIAAAATSEAVSSNDLASLLDTVIQRLEGVSEIARRGA